MAGSLFFLLLVRASDRRHGSHNMMAGSSSSYQYVPQTEGMELIETDDSGEMGYAACGKLTCRRVTKVQITENWRQAKKDIGFVWSKKENMALCPACSPDMSMDKFRHKWGPRQPGAFKPVAQPVMPPPGLPFENSPAVSPTPSARDDRSHCKT